MNNLDEELELTLEYITLRKAFLAAKECAAENSEHRSSAEYNDAKQAYRDFVAKWRGIRELQAAGVIDVETETEPETVVVSPKAIEATAEGGA